MRLNAKFNIITIDFNFKCLRRMTLRKKEETTSNFFFKFSAVGCLLTCQVNLTHQSSVSAHAKGETVSIF